MWASAMALLGAACALAAMLSPASGVSMSQPSTASIQRASSNKTELSAGAESAFVGNYTAGDDDVAACLPLSVKFYDAQRSGRVRSLRTPLPCCRSTEQLMTLHCSLPNEGLPPQVPPADARVAWRKDSGLYDEVQGGFYDAGECEWTLKRADKHRFIYVAQCREQVHI